MPPQSRGKAEDTFQDGTSPGVRMPQETSFSPTPQITGLSIPAVTTSGQRTPTAFKFQASDDGDSTPVRPHFLIDVNETGRKGEKIEETEEVEDRYNDDEFESHYSRQESPVTSSEEEDQDDEQEDDAEDEDIVEMSPTRPRINTNGSLLHRVSSLPASIPYPSQTSQLHLSHSTTSLPRTAPPIPPPLYPPFYNRPPTPLPPSPSLTSLLRPPSLLNRSTASTRPTTPDSSDIETPVTNDDTEAAVASSARRAHPLPPTSPKVPTYEYYGFVLYLASTLAFFLYILWAYLPSPFLHALGITYYPNRWWALAVPAWIAMLLVYIYIALACWNIEYLTLGYDSVETMVDDAGNIAILDDQGRIRKGGSKRFEAELKQTLRQESINGEWNRKKASNHPHSGTTRRKDRRKRDKERDKDVEWRYGYPGEIVNGRVAGGLAWGQIWNEGTDAVMDVPIGGVCQILYGQPDGF